MREPQWGGKDQVSTVRVSTAAAVVATGDRGAEARAEGAGGRAGGWREVWPAAVAGERLQLPPASQGLQAAGGHSSQLFRSPAAPGLSAPGPQRASPLLVA